MVKYLFHPVILLHLCFLQIPVRANQPPKFVNLQSVYFVEGNKPVVHDNNTATDQDSVITPVQANDDDDQTLYFSIDGGNITQIVYLRRDGPKSSSLLVKTSLESMANMQFPFKFTVTDNVNVPISQSALLIVTQVTYTPPSFVNLPNSITVSEDAPFGSSLFKVVATDTNSVSSSIVTFKFETPQTNFQIDSSSGDVTLTSRLDYSLRRVYVLNCVATNNKGLNSTAALTLNVLNAHNRPPYFTNLPYAATILENATAGTSILQVQAFDGNIDLPYGIVYNISYGSLGLFSIDPYSGWIVSSSRLNRDDPQITQRNSTIQMVIQANENQTKPLGSTTSFALVTIQIVDVNDETPTLNQPTYNATVTEYSPVKTFLSLTSPIIVKDNDQGDAGKFRIFLLKDGHPYNGFNVIPDSGINVANVAIQVNDYTLLEAGHQSSITFTIVAQEYLTSANLSSSASVTVYIRDIGSNWPQFSHDEYSVVIDRSLSNGAKVATVSVTNSTNDGTVTYSLHGPFAYLFTINNRTGDVTVNSSPSANQDLSNLGSIDSVSLTVQATNGKGQKTYTVLIAAFRNVNSPPKMVTTFFVGLIKENSDHFEYPLVVQAVDSGSPMYSVLTYSIVGGILAGNFTIGSDSGEIKPKFTLDYEALPPGSNGLITLTVMAKDGQGLNCTAPVVIYVEDVNDNAPIFNQTTYYASVLENSPAGTSVVTVLATDLDGTSPNNQINYQIQPNGRYIFTINSTSGLITINQNNSFDCSSSCQPYILTVTAVDRGSPSLTGSATVNITVIDVNDRPPKFITSNRFVARVDDDVPIGRVVVNCTAMDPDKSASLQYAMIDGSVKGYDSAGKEIADVASVAGLFGIDRTTGSVFVAKALNGVPVQFVMLSISVQDMNGQTLQIDNASLTIIISDVGNRPPQFIPSNLLTAHVFESARAGTEVARIVAVDPVVNDQLVVYSISSDKSGLFDINDANRQTGIITLKNSFGSSMPGVINVTVLAVNSQRTYLNSTTVLQIVINKDSAVDVLEWKAFPATVYLWDNVTVGTPIANVLATYRNGSAGIIKYFVTSDAAGKFSIAAETGVIVTTGLLDAFVTPQYQLTIEARDVTPSTNVASINQVMTIVIRGTNRYRPTFDQSMYSATIPRDTPIGRVVLIMHATDLDSGLNGAVTYSIDRRTGNGSSLFDIDPITGALSVLGPLQVGDQYLTVVATDRGNVALWSSVTVKVVVTDVAYGQLLVVTPPQNSTIYVQQNSPADQFVARIVAQYQTEKDNNSRPVGYRLDTTLADWSGFKIDASSGILSTAMKMDRNIQSRYIIKVIAYDPSKLDNTNYLNLIVMIRDQPATSPVFDRTQLSIPYQVYLPGMQGGTLVAKLNLAKYNVGVTSIIEPIICYYIVGGNKESFSLDKQTANLYLSSHIEADKSQVFNLVVKATDDCWSGFWEIDENRNVVWNASDSSLLLVQAAFQEHVCAGPKFLNTWFHVGICPPYTQLGDTLLEMMKYTDNRGYSLHYRKNPVNRFSDSLSQVAGNWKTDPLIVTDMDGLVQTNTFFQEGWNGSIEFEVYVNSSDCFNGDVANVTVYLLGKDSLVRVLVHNSRDQVASFSRQFVESISSATGYVVDVYAMYNHKTSQPDNMYTDLLIYSIDPRNRLLVSGSEFIQNSAHLTNLFASYNVTNVTLADFEALTGSLSSQSSTSSRSYDMSVVIAFAVVGASLLIFLLAFCVVVFICRSKYRRKIKDANSLASVSSKMNSFDTPTITVRNPERTTESVSTVWQNNDFSDINDSDSKNSSTEENTIESTSQTHETNQNVTRTGSEQLYCKFNGFKDPQSDPGSISFDDLNHISAISNGATYLGNGAHYSSNGANYGSNGANYSSNGANYGSNGANRPSNGSNHSMNGKIHQNGKMSTNGRPLSNGNTFKYEGYTMQSTNI